MTAVAVAGVAAFTVTLLLAYVVRSTGRQWVSQGRHHVKPRWPRRPR